MIHDREGHYSPEAHRARLRLPAESCGGRAPGGRRCARDASRGDAAQVLFARGAGNRRARALVAAGRGGPRRGDRRAAPLPAHGEALHLPAPGGRSAADGDLRLQAEDEGTVRPGSARFHPPGAAPHHHDQRPDPLSRSRPPSSTSRSTARPAPGSANCCPIRRAWPTISRSCAACTPRPSTTNRRSRFSRPA